MTAPLSAQDTSEMNDRTREANLIDSEPKDPTVQALLTELRRKTEALEKIATGTEDLIAPYRALGETQMRRVAREALRSLHGSGEGNGRSGASLPAHPADAAATDTRCELERICRLLVTYGGIVATAYTPDDQPDRIRLSNGDIIKGEVADVLMDMARTVTSLAQMAQSALSNGAAS